MGHLKAVEARRLAAAAAGPSAAGGAAAHGGVDGGGSSSYDGSANGNGGGAAGHAILPAATSTDSPGPDSRWVLSTAAGLHMVSSLDLLHDPRRPEPGMAIAGVSGSIVPEWVGTAILETTAGAILHLGDTYLVPTLPCRGIVSLGTLFERGVKMSSCGERLVLADGATVAEVGMADYQMVVHVDRTVLAGDADVVASSAAGAGGSGSGGQ